MLKLSTSLVAVLILSSLVFAQRGSKRADFTGAQPNTNTCAFTFTSGLKHGLTQYCVTANGNIAQFSAGTSGGFPQEFLNLVFPAIEGYGLCDFTDGNNLVAYWDYASNASTNWNPATAVATPTSVTITRTTADGIWQLVQTITEMKGSRTAFGAAKITMALTNLSPTDRFMLLNRHAYVQGGFNDYDVSEVSAHGGPSFGNGNHFDSTASFITTKFDFGFSMVMTAPGGPTPCQSFQNQGGIRDFFRGDAAIEQVFNFDIGPGKTKTATITYKPF